MGPGWAAMEMAALAPKEVNDRIREAIPLKTAAEPSDIANLLLFFAYPGASHIIGTVVMSNGDWNVRIAW